MWHVCHEKFLYYRLYSPNAAFGSHLSYLTAPDPHISLVKSRSRPGSETTKRNAEPGVWLGIACRAICVRALRRQPAPSSVFTESLPPVVRVSQSRSFINHADGLHGGGAVVPCQLHPSPLALTRACRAARGGVRPPEWAGLTEAPLSASHCLVRACRLRCHHPRVAPGDRGRPANVRPVPPSPEPQSLWTPWRTPQGCPREFPQSESLDCFAAVRLCSAGPSCS